MNKETVLQAQPLLLNVSQVAKTLGLSRTMVYTLIATQGLPIVRFGRAVRVSPISLQRWLEKREKQLAAS